MNSSTNDLLQIGFLYNDPFGVRLINNLINKSGFCQQCGPLCINCRILYPWFAGKIKYAHKLEWEDCECVEDCLPAVEEKLSSLDVLICIALPSEFIEVLPALLKKYSIRAVIFPVENGEWLSAHDQMVLQSQLKISGIQYAFPRPFCNLSESNSPEKSIINRFIQQFHIGKPIVQFSTQNGKIIKTQVIQSSPCGATYFIAQYLRNEQLNTWNVDPLEKRISVALNKYPCTAVKTRDDTLKMITRVKAEQITQDVFKKALAQAEKLD
ncbi:DUF166 family protein [Candidatus Lokiarchaeum ossiferum]|uniref:DUF166 family protein n=1 Tax=Candidatus Lokiarchaeum ossiferum TaxID=2951803 RepID=UPI00352F5D92